MTKTKGPKTKISYPNKNRQAKKAAVLNKPKTTLRPWLIAAAVILVAVAGMMAYFMDRGDSQVSFQPATPPAIISPNVVTYPAATFADGVARHFEHRHGDITIRYFILRSSDGVIRAAFDACDVCWPAGKGYYQKGDTMVCRNCSRRFKSVLVNEVKGGCNPAPLKRQIDGQNLVIHVDDIRKGQRYFDFKGKA
jgi:uncharacterized membrane protein